MRRMLAAVLLIIGLALGGSGCSAANVQLWWNLNGGATRPLSTAQAQAIADRINAQCHPSYWGCLPYVSDVDCAGGSGNGPVYTGAVLVIGPDDYGLDADHDGLGCEDS